MPPVRGPSYHFPPSHLPSHPPPPPSSAAIKRLDDPVQHSPATDTGSENRNPALRSLQLLNGLLNLTKENRGIAVAVGWGLIGAAAIVEDLSSVPDLREVSLGLVGFICAGAVVYAVLTLEGKREGEGGWLEEEFDGAWGPVWRRMRDLMDGHEGEEGGEEVTTMFDEEGRSVFLVHGFEQEVSAASMLEHDPASADVSTQPVLDPSSATSSSRYSYARSVPHESRLPPDISRTVKVRPSPRRMNHRSSYPYPHLPYGIDRNATFQHPDRQDRADKTTRRPCRRSASPTRDAVHPSGLLGPSPMPARHAELGWKHFAGEGFWKHQQKMRRVSELLHPGSGRLLEDIVQEAKGMNGWDCEEWAGS